MVKPLPSKQVLRVRFPSVPPKKYNMNRVDNMRTPEEIKAAKRCIRSVGWKNCSNCPYHGRGKPPCIEAATKDVEKYIDKHEKDTSVK